MFTSLLGLLPLCIVAGVYFDPDVYMVNEGGNVTLILRTNVTVNKRFSVLVNTLDYSANSEYCINTAFIVKCSLFWTVCANHFLLQLPLVYVHVHTIHLFHSNVVHLSLPT